MTAPLTPRSRPGPPVLGLAAALLAGAASLALYGCGKRDEPSQGGEDPAVRQKRMDESQRNLKQIGLALHNFNGTYKQLPPGAVCDKKTGKPLLSWRVALLPFLEHEALFKEFRLDEPWDGPNNKKLLDKLPA